MRTTFTLLAALLAIGCSSSSDESPAQKLCAPRAQVACPCDSHATGIQTCQDDGLGFTPCQCPSYPEAGEASSLLLEAGQDSSEDAELEDAELEASACIPNICENMGLSCGTVYDYQCQQLVECGDCRDGGLEAAYPSDAGCIENLCEGMHMNCGTIFDSQCQKVINCGICEDAERCVQWQCSP